MQNKLTLICAQPSTLYYAWQTEVMLNSCLDTGISLFNVHVVCWKTGEVIPDEWQRLQNGYKANFFFYDDTRVEKQYPSSIRPNVLKQHFFAHPELEQSAIFYFDCDIVFTNSIDWVKFMADDRWYGSDTRSYIGYEYILSKGRDILEEMLQIVDIPEDVVKDNEINSIGAQYLMKGIDWIYWEIVEFTCESLFTKITAMNVVKQQADPSYHELQIWCADMWAVLWTAWQNDHETVVHDDLQFAWATSSEYDWNYTNIFHNAGAVGGDGLFNKIDYIGTLPYNTDLKITEGTASKKYYDYVQKVGKKTVLFDHEEEPVITLEYKTPLTELKIVSATYGGVDCTEQVRARVTNGKLRMRANNDIIGDPQVGKRKELVISIEYKGEGGTAIYKEGQIVDLPYSSNTRLGIFYTNNNNPKIFPSISKSLDRIAIASEGKADIITCVWNRIASNPFNEIVSWYQSQSHLNQLLQILQCLYNAKELNQYEYVSFLEHDVMYGEGYFDYPEFEKGTVLTNMNYGGLCSSGWQKRNQNDEPFHQMTMHLDDAIEHCLAILPNALRTNSGNIESDKLIRKTWMSPNESIHINHGVHFTSHFNIYSNRCYPTHQYWGEYSNYAYFFPVSKIKETVSAWAVSIVPPPSSEEMRVAAARLEVCTKCEFWEEGVVDRCSVCSCQTSNKVFNNIATAPCPKNKWAE